MISNFKLSNKRQIENSINMKLEQLPFNIPCKVDKVNDDYTVNVVSLIDNVLYSNISIYYPTGMYFDPNRLKNGLLIHSDYWFGSLRETGKLERSIKCTLTQFGIFVPLFDNEDIKLIDNNVKTSEFAIFNKDATNKITLETDNIIVNNKDKAYMTMEDGIVTIKNNNDNETIVMNNNIEITSKQDVFKLDNGISLNSSTPIEFKTQIASLKDIVDGLIECINLASIPTSTAPGTPSTPNPGLTAKIIELQTKINGVLK